MFRWTTLRRNASILTVSTLLTTSGAALAQESSVERILNEETGNYELNRTVTGDNGVITTQRVCGEGSRENDAQGCVRQRTNTGADGNTATGTSALIQGPQRTRAVGKVTGPDGGERRFLRRFKN